MAVVKIGFFALKDNVGCTSFSIHAANYLACGDKSVALIESKTILEPKFHTAETIFEEDGTFISNGVRYYPAECDALSSEDIQIIDYGKITVLHEFEKDVDKLFLCTDGQGDDIPDLMEYINESGISCELLIIGGSKEQLNLYKEQTNLHAILIPTKTDVYCPADLVLKISILFRNKGLVAPEQNRTWKLEKIKFGNGPVKPDEEKEKQVFSLFGKKKKKIAEIPDDKPVFPDPEPDVSSEPEEIKEQEEETTVIEASDEEEEVLRSNTFTEIAYVDVPEPVEEKPEETLEEPITENNYKKAIKEPEVIETSKNEPVKKLIPEPEIVHSEKEKRKAKNTYHKEKKKPLFDLNKFKESASKAVSVGSGLVEQIKAREKTEKPERKQKIIHTGHITVFVTSFRHGCGASYTAGSIASSMASIYSKDVYIERLDRSAALPDDYMVKEITDEETQFEAYKNGLIVYDKGLFDSLNEVDKSDMIHADMNVMVCTNDDMSRIAQFIHSQGDNAYSWLFVFNHVLPSQKKDIEDALADYNVLILPFHDFSAVPPKLIKSWKEAIKACSTRV